MNILLKTSLLFGLVLATPILTINATSTVSAQAMTEAEAFVEAKRLSTIEGWQAFLKKYPAGTKSEFAAAYLERLQPKAGNSAASSNGGLASSKTTWSIIVTNALGVSRAEELSGATICFVSGSPALQAVSEYFQRHNMVFEKVESNSIGEARQHYENGACDGLIEESSQSLSTQNILKAPGNHRILPQIITCKNCT